MMTDDRAGLPLDWEIVAKGFTPQELFDFLKRERKLTSAQAIDQMNSRGRALRWQIVRRGDEKWLSKMAGPFINHIWDLDGDERVVIVPPLAAQHVFMVLQDEVRRVWQTPKKKNTPTEIRRTAVKDTFEETGKPGRGGISWPQFYKKVYARLPKNASWQERTIQRDVEDILNQRL